MISRDKFYAVFALILLVGLFLTDYRGWTFENVDEIKQVPKSVRNNPGVYRSHYQTHYHFYGGK